MLFMQPILTVFTSPVYIFKIFTYIISVYYNDINYHCTLEDVDNVILHFWLDANSLFLHNDKKQNKKNTEFIYIYFNDN